MNYRNLVDKVITKIHNYYRKLTKYCKQNFENVKDVENETITTLIP